MSDQAGAEGRGSFRRRRPQGGRGAGRGGRAAGRGRGPSTGRGAGETKPRSDSNDESPHRRDPPPADSMPADTIGKTLTGTVVSVIRRGKFNFGFISLSTADDFFDHKYPRVYFNPSHVGTEGLFLRTGYQVQFTATNDEEGRSVATSINLTEQGTKTKAEREESIAKKRAERQQAEENGEATEERPKRRTQQRRPRPVVDGKKVTLKVTCEGHQDTKSVEADLGHSIGELRTNASALFNAPSNYGIYTGGNFLSKVAYNGLNDNDTIHLAPRKEN
jgi:hypothetical protein